MVQHRQGTRIDIKNDRRKTLKIGLDSFEFLKNILQKTKVDFLSFSYRYLAFALKYEMV